MPTGFQMGKVQSPEAPLHGGSRSTLVTRVCRGISACDKKIGVQKVSTGMDPADFGSKILAPTNIPDHAGMPDGETDMKTSPLLTIPPLLLLLFFAAPLLPSQQEPEKSLGTSNQLVSLEITNPGGMGVAILWVNFEGQEQDFGTVPPQGTATLQTYQGHLWHFKQNGKQVSRYRATAAVQQAWTIGREATAPKGGPQEPSAPAPDLKAAVPFAGAETGSHFTKQQANAFVAYHNEKRAEVGVDKVTWSTELAREAQEWADHMAETGEFEHRPRQGANATQHGENLAAGFGGGYDVLSGARDWYGEKRLYGDGSAVTQTSYLKTGHYTQMVWSQTSEIGAGVAVGKRGQLKGWTIVVCNYNPPGNMLGQKPY